MPERLTRRDFLKVAGAGTVGVAALGTSAALGSRYGEYLPKGGSKVNVIVVIVDSLRRDHVGAYGNPWIETPNLDALAKESLLFTRPYPESIPTIPARGAIHTGVRTWPFRDWHPVSDDGFKPYGWAPVPEDQVRRVLEGEKRGRRQCDPSNSAGQWRRAAGQRVDEPRRR